MAEKTTNTEQNPENAELVFEDNETFFDISEDEGVAEYRYRPELRAVAKAARAYIAKKFDYSTAATARYIVQQYLGQGSFGYCFQVTIEIGGAYKEDVSQKFPCLS